jgi:hypothetical protein
MDGIEYYRLLRLRRPYATRFQREEPRHHEGRSSSTVPVESKIGGILKGEKTVILASYE